MPRPQGRGMESTCGKCTAFGAAQLPQLDLQDVAVKSLAKVVARFMGMTQPLR